MLKKIAIIILLFIALPLSFVYADHNKEHQIEQLLEKIASLQSQITTLQSNFVQCEFTKNLSIGAKGTMVICLQNYLRNLGYFAYSLGPTGYFGKITENSVISDVMGLDSTIIRFCSFRYGWSDGIPAKFMLLSSSTNIFIGPHVVSASMVI